MSDRGGGAGEVLGKSHPEEELCAVAAAIDGAVGVVAASGSGEEVRSVAAVEINVLDLKGVDEVSTVATIAFMGEYGDNDEVCSINLSICVCALSDAKYVLDGDGLSTIVSAKEVLEACAKMDSLIGRLCDGGISGSSELSNRLRE